MSTEEITEAQILEDLIQEETQEENQPTAPQEEQKPAEEPQEPKKGRGRPKGTTKKEKPEAAPEEGTQKKKSENIDDYLKEFEKTTIPTQDQSAAQNAPEGQKIPEATVVINGYMVLVIADFVIPSLISIALPMFSGYTIDTKVLKLDKQERAELKPFADEAAKSLVLNMSPLQLFLICLGSMYTEKTITMMKKK
jgi:hypothetical protein